jgi:hypothetical protein
MKAVGLGLAIALAATVQASAAEIDAPHKVYRASVAREPPLALRTLSRRSASVLASDPCWRGCTTGCGSGFQRCIRSDLVAGCMAHNNACELVCLKQCRLSGGPLVSWTDY